MEVNPHTEVQELIRNLATLTLPQLLKWMIVNISINELNNCLRNLGVVDILPSPSPGPDGRPPSRGSVSSTTSQRMSATSTSNLDIPSSTTEGEEYSDLVYRIITSSRNTKLIPLVVMPDPNEGVYYAKYRATDIYRTNHGEYIKKCEPTKKPMSGKSALGVYKFLQKKN